MKEEEKRVFEVCLRLVDCEDGEEEQQEPAAAADVWDLVGELAERLGSFNSIINRLRLVRRFAEEAGRRADRRLGHEERFPVLGKEAGPSGRWSSGCRLNTLARSWSGSGRDVRSKDCRS